MTDKVKDLNKRSKKEFLALPERESWDTDIGLISSLVVLPTRRKHDSGYRVMDFVAVVSGVPKCRVSGSSDVLHLEGIGGYGIYNSKSRDRKTPTRTGWSIDCLMTSGLLHLFCEKKIKIGAALSSFQIYSVDTEQ